MVSSSERQRLARLFEQQSAAMGRQKEALTRMTLMLTEASAALYQIADMLERNTLADATGRAQAALDRMERIRDASTATGLSERESAGNEPTEEETHD